MNTNWPEMLWIVRHGQRAVNVARDHAEAGGWPVIELAWRDIDVPLSDAGVTQSEALADWFSRLPRDEQPEVVVCSPYVRARETARRVVEHPGMRDTVLRLDERLREWWIKPVACS